MEEWKRGMMDSRKIVIIIPIFQYSNFYSL